MLKLDFNHYGKINMSKLFPTQINMHKKSRLLEIEFNDEKVVTLSCEFLRTQSKSAEVQSSDIPVICPF